MNELRRLQWGRRSHFAAPEIGLGPNGTVSRVFSEPCQFSSAGGFPFRRHAPTGPLPHEELVQPHCGALQRGSLIVWLDKEMAWLAPHDGSPGRPAVFSDASIQLCLTIKVLFKLPARQTTGMVASLLKMADLGWAVPDQATLCRRQKILAVQMPCRRADGPLNLLVPSRALLHNTLPVNVSMGSPVLPDLLDQIAQGEEIGTAPLVHVNMHCRAVDGACDTRRCPSAIIARDATPIIPIRKNGRLWKEDGPSVCARNDTLRATRYHGRAFWKRWTGYHDSSRIEANPLMVRKQTTAGQRMRCLKAFGERIAARDPDKLTAEIHTRILRRLSRTGGVHLLSHEPLLGPRNG